MVVSFIIYSEVYIGIFFFKQKTAYEMRISDWSSDVCSSDLRAIVGGVYKGFLDPNLKTHLDYVDDELGKHVWFAGATFSAADIQMSFGCEAAAARGGPVQRAHIAAFLDRIHARPAYARALASGGPYQLMK